MASIDKNLFNNNNNLSTTSFRTRIMGLQKNNLIKLKSNKSRNIFANKSLSKSNSLNFNAISLIEERLSFLKNFPLIFFLNNTPKKTQIYFQESGSLLMNELISFHDDVMCLITFIVIFVLYTLLALIINFFVKDSLAFKKYIKKYEANYNSTLEIIWTIIPAVILLIIVIPAFSLLLYFSSNDRIDNNEPSFVVNKIIGHQRYWTYEYFDFNGNSITFDGYLLPIDELILGSFRNSDEDDLEYFFNCCVKKEQEENNEYVEFDEEDGGDVWDGFFSKPKDKPVLEKSSEKQEEIVGNNNKSVAEKSKEEEERVAKKEKEEAAWLSKMFVVVWTITTSAILVEILVEVIKEFIKK